MSTSFLRFCLLTGLLALASTASAQTAINFAFRIGDTYTGASANPGSASGDYWNSSQTNYDYFLYTNYPGLLDSTGAVTTVTLKENTPDTGNFYLGGITGNGIPIFDGYAHAGSDSPSMDFRLSGLAANAQFTLYLYMARNFGSESDPQSFSATQGGNPQETVFYGPQDLFIEGTNYVRFANVETNGLGELNFSVAGSSMLNGFTLVEATALAIPEPSTYAALAGVGALGLALWRRRQHAV